MQVLQLRNFESLTVAATSHESLTVAATSHESLTVAVTSHESLTVAANESLRVAALQLHMKVLQLLQLQAGCATNSPACAISCLLFIIRKLVGRYSDLASVISNSNGSIEDRFAASNV